MASMRAMRIAGLGILIAAGMSAAVACAAQPRIRQDYPARPVRLVSGVPGSPSDILARTIQPKMADTFGHPVVIENRSGGSGMISANIVAKAPPDGHTLLLIPAQFTI